MNLTESLKWRYATKRMTDQKISEKDLNTIIGAISLAPTAFGLQPFRVVVTEKQELLQEIFEKSCPQIVVQQCSHLLIFKAYKNISDEHRESYLRLMKEKRNVTDDYIETYRQKIKRVQNSNQINTFEWAIRQAYIALGFAMVAAADLRIDATPIEGFNPAALNEILHIDTSKEETVVLLTLGYRDEANDHLADMPKLRKPLDELIEKI